MHITAKTGTNPLENDRETGFFKNPGFSSILRATVIPLYPPQKKIFRQSCPGLSWLFKVGDAFPNPLPISEVFWPQKSRAQSKK
jgi:hypothetical protein